MLFFMTMIYKSKNESNPNQNKSVQRIDTYKEEAHRCMELQLSYYNNFKNEYEKYCKREVKVQEPLHESILKKSFPGREKYLFLEGKNISSTKKKKISIKC